MRISAPLLLSARPLHALATMLGRAKMSWTLGRAAALAAIVATAVAVTGCDWSRPPASAAVATRKASPASNPAAERLADAPALLIQCIVDRGVLRPAVQDWFSGSRVRINSDDALDFAEWWHAYFTPGPYKQQTFLIDGHRTHYLAFGARWTQKNGQWVPLHRAKNDPMAQRTSLYAWSLWTASHDRLPAQVCGPGASARQLQQEVFGKLTADPWAS